MTFKEYAKTNEDFDVAYDDLSEIVNPNNTIECKQNIIWVIERLEGCDPQLIYETLKSVVSAYYGGIAFE